MYFLRCHCKISQLRGRVEAKKRLPVQMIFANADSRNGLYCTIVDHQLTTGSDFCCRWLVFVVGKLFYIGCCNSALVVQNQQKITAYHRIACRVVVLRPGRPEVRILPVAPESCDKKDVAGFFFAVSSKIGSFTTQFWDAVLQCCPTILGRFPQLDAHFPCRFLEFGRRRGNFFEKNRINPAVFRMFQFPRSHFPLAAGFFRFLQLPAKWELPALSFRSPLCECVAGSQIGYLLCEDCKFLIHVWRCHTIRITRKVSPPCVRRAKQCSGPFL